MHDPKAEGRRWLGQAENNLAFARYALGGAFFHHVCFIAQQASEVADPVGMTTLTPGSARARRQQADHGSALNRVSRSGRSSCPGTRANSAAQRSR